MIISHKHRFIFVKTLKTAGTSIEVFLSKFCGPDDIVTPIEPRVEPHRPRNHSGYFNHMPATEIRRRVNGSVWDAYFKFCVERNPWDKVLSHYHMLKFRNGGSLDFDEFLNGADMPLNFPIYTEAGCHKQIVVDRVLRYESLSSELTEVLCPLGLPYSGQLPVRAKAEYRTDRRHYHEVFTRAQADLVGRLFTHELHLHGYVY